MDRNAYVPFDSNSDDQQRKYVLIESLQKIVKKLPINSQRRLSYDFLSDIASCLLDRAIFTIVCDLEEIQHLTEKNWYTQRQVVIKDHKNLKQNLKTKQKEELQICRPHNMALLNKEHELQTINLDKRIQLELDQYDKKMMTELDLKVAGQQATLQGAGVPGFFVTRDKKDVRLQMLVLQLIREVLLK